jgi:hypothetical protein
MKYKNLILILAAGLLILPAFCFADVNYSRTPSGFSISNPVNFQLLGVFDTYGDAHSWHLKYYYDDNQTVISQCFTTNNGTDIQILPLDNYFFVQGRFYIDGSCLIANYDHDTFFEYDMVNPVFEVVEPPPTPQATIIPFDLSHISSILNYVADIFYDLRLLVVLAMGLPLGFWIILHMIHLNEIEKIRQKHFKKFGEAIPNYPTKEEKEFKKLGELIKEKKADQLGLWLEKFSKEGDFWNKSKSKKDDWL